jgi:hypothetical protein
MLNYEAVAASDVQAPDAAAAGNGPSLPGGPPQTPEAVAQPGMVVNGEALQAPAMPEQAGEAGGQDAPEVQDNGGRRRHHIAPYIEARQVLDAELSLHLFGAGSRRRWHGRRPQHPGLGLAAL